MGREEHLMEVLPPLDWSRTGKETWGEVFSNINKEGFLRFIRLFLPGNKEAKAVTSERIFDAIRQPDWWQGDSDYHEKTHNQPVSDLEKELRSGKFVVTSEITPPMGTSTGKLVRDIAMMKSKVTALNFTDNASACSRMSSLAACKISVDQGLEPVLQIASRDENRIGLQSQVIGAAALGIRNILCVSGDSPLTGPDPAGNMNILDLDAIQMLWILRRMRDEGVYLDGRKIKYPPGYFLGAAASPYASDAKFQALREHKKVNAGAQFLQTNLIFDIEGLDKWLEELYKRDVLGKVYILAGVAPLKNIKIARYLNSNIPGVTVPERYIRRFEEHDECSSESIGKDIAVELINSIKQKQGINGVHIMPVGWESVIPQLIEECKL
jgi:methylenetetrahydrofolate reductase (NADPH)